MIETWANSEHYTDPDDEALINLDPESLPEGVVTFSISQEGD